MMFGPGEVICKPFAPLHASCRYRHRISRISLGSNHIRFTRPDSPLQLESVDYWFASRHLDELNAAREADSLLPSGMELGEWRGTKYGMYPRADMEYLGVCALDNMSAACAAQVISRGHGLPHQG